jgi:hypothetical protein
MFSIELKRIYETKNETKKEIVPYEINSTHLSEDILADILTNKLTKIHDLYLDDFKIKRIHLFRYFNVELSEFIFYGFNKLGKWCNKSSKTVMSKLFNFTQFKKEKINHNYIFGIEKGEYSTIFAPKNKNYYFNVKSDNNKVTYVKKISKKSFLIIKFEMVNSRIEISFEFKSNHNYKVLLILFPWKEDGKESLILNISTNIKDQKDKDCLKFCEILFNEIGLRRIPKNFNKEDNENLFTTLECLYQKSIIRNKMCFLMCL